MFYLIFLVAAIQTCSMQAMVQPGFVPSQIQLNESLHIQKLDISDGLHVHGMHRGTTALLNKEAAQHILPQSQLGKLIRANDVDAIRSKCEGSWWYKYFISQQETQQCIVFGLLYGAALKSEQSGKVVDYFVDKIRENQQRKTAFFAEVDDSAIENTVKNCHRKLLSVLMEKFPQRVKKAFEAQQASLECHTRILAAVHQYLPNYDHIDYEVITLFNQYTFDEQLIAALLPMTQLPLINGKIDVNKLDEKRNLDRASLRDEVVKMLGVIDALFDSWLKNTAKRLLVSYLSAGLQE